MNSSPHVDNKGKNILILGIGPTQGLGEHSLTAEKLFSINFTVTRKKFCLSQHYNGITKFKAKDSVVASPLCLGNISKDWSADNMEQTDLNGYVYEFNVDYDNYGATNYSKFIPYIHNCLIVKYNIK